MADLAKLTPAEIDALWLDARAPLDKLIFRKHDLLATARKYERAGASYAAQAQRYYERALELDERIDEARKPLAPFDAEWKARGGWTRAYVVPGGHIHRSTSCHTLHPTTIVGWLPEQSGWDEAAIVEAAGVHACTVCYPSAPVEALRAAEAAAKAASECPGSRGYDYDRSTYRQTSYTGTGRAICSHCRQHIGTSKTGKLRAHKPVVK